jgi:hypothetical protein
VNTNIKLGLAMLFGFGLGAVWSTSYALRQVRPPMSFRKLMSPIRMPMRRNTSRLRTRHWLIVARRGSRQVAGRLRSQARRRHHVSSCLRSTTLKRLKRPIARRPTWRPARSAISMANSASSPSKDCHSERSVHRLRLLLGRWPFADSERLADGLRKFALGVVLMVGQSSPAGFSDSRRGMGAA